MDLHLFQSAPLNSIITIFFILILVQTSYSKEECTRPFQCGRISNISYPFWGTKNRSKDCGLEVFKLYCEENQYPIIDIDVQKFRVLHINQAGQTMTIALMGNGDDVCTPEKLNVTMNHSLFDYPVTSQNLSLFYNCSKEHLYQVPYKEISCPKNNGIVDRVVYIVNRTLLDIHRQILSEACEKNISVPVLETNLNLLLNEDLNLQETLDRGFDVVYGKIQGQCEVCARSGDSCVYDNSNFLCRRNDDSKRKVKLVIGALAGLLGILLSCIIFCCYVRRTTSMAFSRKMTKNDKDLEAFIRSHETLSLQRYSFSSVEKMTNSFKDKLGQGGYGSVYKGKLLDGRLVAVKVLNASKGNGEEFINEVASISRTSHVNIVNLLGFCLEGCKRALVYEFMPNGSLEKYINNDITLKANCLGWEKLYQIAIGVARGLEYLHRGCNTRILHFDIKPHNILLDEDFCPKISDFGLAKLCTNKKESIISMLEARGTIGYIAPEVFSRTFGGVSYKSDVYSYGMMVLDMVGGRKNIDVGVNHTSETYFPHWVYKRLEIGTEFELHGVTTGEETEIVRKMTLVGLWCIQTKPSGRPSMSKVIEMLKGSVEALEIPPRPFLSSPPKSPPPRSPSDFSTTSLSLS